MESECVVSTSSRTLQRAQRIEGHHERMLLQLHRNAIQEPPSLNTGSQLTNNASPGSGWGCEHALIPVKYTRLQYTPERGTNGTR